MGHQGHVRGKTLQEALDRYEKEVTPKKRGRKAEFNRIQQLKREGFSHLLLDELRDSHIQRFVDDGLSRGLKGSSVNRDLSLLSAVFTTCRKKWKWIQHNPLDGVDKPKEPAPRNRRISDDEIASVLKAIKYDPEAKHDRIKQGLGVAFLLAIETAMRQGEIYGLQWKHVHLGQRKVFLPLTKNGHSREVPLSSFAIELIGRMKGAHKVQVFPFNQGSSSTIFREALKEASIENMTFHDTRHEATTRLSKRYSNVLEISAVTGHSDLKSLRVYYNPTASELAEKLD